MRKVRKVFRLDSYVARQLEAMSGYYGSETSALVNAVGTQYERLRRQGDVPDSGALMRLSKKGFQQVVAKIRKAHGWDTTSTE